MLEKVIIKIRRKLYKIWNSIKIAYITAKVRTIGPSGKMVAIEMEIDIYHNDGVMHLGCKEYEKAIECFKKEVACDPEHNLGYEGLGWTYEEMGMKEEARKNYMTAIKNTKRMIKETPGEVSERILKDMEEELAGLEGARDAKEV